MDGLFYTVAPSEKQSFRGHTLSAQLMHDPLKVGKNDTPEVWGCGATAL